MVKLIVLRLSLIAPILVERLDWSSSSPAIVRVFTEVLIPLDVDGEAKKMSDAS